MMYKIKKLDLYSDWLEIAKKELQNEGYEIENLSDDKISILYFTLQKKLIKPSPRKIFKSDIFICPNEHLEGLYMLEQKIICGDDLRPYLTRKLKKINDLDGLLFDWGIYHLHLGKKIENDGFIKRTGPLLYAKFDNNTAYFINVIEHGAWTTQDLIKIIHKNWPDSIKDYRAEGAIKLNTKFNDSDIKILRKAKINVMIEVEEGVVYLGPGGGITGSGDSAECTFQHLQNRKGIKNLEKNIASDTESFLLKQYNNLDFIKKEILEFALKKVDSHFFIFESNNDFKIQL